MEEARLYQLIALLMTNIAMRVPAMPYPDQYKASMPISRCRNTTDTNGTFKFRLCIKNQCDIVDTPGHRPDQVKGTSVMRASAVNSLS